MPSFFLDKPTGDKETFIFLFENCADGRLKYSTREKIVPGHWDSSQQRPKLIKGNTRVKELSMKLARVTDAVETFRANSYMTNDPFTKEKVTEIIQVQLGHREKSTRVKFKDAADLIIKDMGTGKLLTPRGKKKYSAGTIKNYRQSLNCLVEFSTSARVSLEFSDVTMITYNRFIEWCHSQDWTMNYTGQHLKNWKCIMEFSRVRGLHKNAVHNTREFKTLHEETYDIALTEGELKALADIDVTSKPNYQVARDWFLIGCYTGLRVSDLKRLNADKLNGNIILLMNEKTDEKVVIPVHPVVHTVLEKRDGKFPPAMADQKINDYIKPVAKLAGIKGRELYSVTQGGGRKDYYMQRWEMVSLHTARRSFISNARSNGIPDSIVMRLTGIRKPQTLQRYDKTSPEQAAQIAANHTFFK